jgi:hypothetical protein
VLCAKKKKKEFSLSWAFLRDFFDYAGRDGGSHIANCEASQFWKVSIRFDCDGV